MSIASFRLDEADQTANVQPTMKLDFNGDKCALIKIITTQKNFSFDVGSLGVFDTEFQNAEHPSEIWLYVPNGVMRISIQHPQLGAIKDYDLGGRLKKGRTYILELTSDQINTLTIDYDNSQILDIDIYPPNAEIFINGVKQNLENGHASIQLPFGNHNYRIIAENYHPVESQISINDKENKHHLDVRLKQAFGYLVINTPSEIKSGELYVDDVQVGTLPMQQYALKSGTHKVAVHPTLYSTYVENITMTDSAIVTINPTLKPNNAEYEIIVSGDNEATLYCDGEILGEGHWKGLLEAGDHIIEARKQSHRTTNQKITIVNGVDLKFRFFHRLPYMAH